MKQGTRNKGELDDIIMIIKTYSVVQGERTTKQEKNQLTLILDNILLFS